MFFCVNIIIINYFLYFSLFFKEKLLLDDNSESGSNTFHVNTQTSSLNQLSPNRSVEFHVPEVSIDVVNTAYERHTSGLMSTYLYHILIKVIFKLV